MRTNKHQLRLKYSLTYVIIENMIKTVLFTYFESKKRKVQCFCVAARLFMTARIFMDDCVVSTVAFHSAHCVIAPPKDRKEKTCLTNAVCYYLVSNCML